MPELTPPDAKSIELSQHIEGSPGNDRIEAIRDRNTLLGKGGRDQLIVEGDDNVVDGGPSNDQLSASGNRNSLMAGSGRDLVDADAEVTTLMPRRKHRPISTVALVTTSSAPKSKPKAQPSTFRRQHQLVSTVGLGTIRSPPKRRHLLSGSGGKDELTAMASAFASDGPVEARNGLSGGAGNDLLVVEGKICRVVLKTAGTVEADPIVMGSHHPELNGHLLGPKVAKAMCHADCLNHCGKGVASAAKSIGLCRHGEHDRHCAPDERPAVIPQHRA